MAFDAVPWVVGGGAEIGPEVARILAFGASGGESGCVSVGDLSVQPLAVPGGSVRILPGAFVAASNFVGGVAQSYIGRAPTETVVPVTPTGSGGSRIDLVIAEIVDPQYVGSAPADPINFEYARPRIITGISAANAATGNAALAYMRAQGITGIPLARINMPASTSTVGGGGSNGTITNLRELVQPRQRRVLWAHAGTTRDPDQVLNAGTAGGEMWPQFGWNTEIPTWATRVKVIGSWNQIFVPNSSNAYGYVGVSFGLPGSDPTRFMTQETAFDIASVANNQRVNFFCADDLYIAPSLRGTIKYVHLRGRYNGVPPAAQRLKADAITSMYVDVEYQESAADFSI